MADRDGGGSRGRLTFQWNPADHATYCPQHSEPPEDGGGSSWLCCCSGPLSELRAAGQALIDAAPAFGSNAWAEAYDVWDEIVAEQERLEAFETYVHPDIASGESRSLAEVGAELAAEDRAGEVAFRGEERVAELEERRTVDSAVLEKARNAEASLIEEYRMWRQTWESNPTMDAMKDGILAIRALVAELEREANRG